MFIEKIYKYKFYVVDKMSIFSFDNKKKKLIEDLLKEIFAGKKVSFYYDEEISKKHSFVSSLVYLIPPMDEKLIDYFLLKLSSILDNNNYEIFLEDLEKNIKGNLVKLLDREYRYSEIFGNTFQGEGKYTGINTVWYRSWGCNFNCNGFGQKNPYEPSSWKLDYLEINPDNYQKMEDLPVFERGCDSSYSWSKRFYKLSKKSKPSEIVTEIEKFLKNEFNPEGKFLHNKTKQWTHMAFTGGEPMLSQSAIIAILMEFFHKYNMPRNVTVETNGSIKIRPELFEFITELYCKKKDKENDLHFYVLTDDENLESRKSMINFYDREWFWSVSPKLSISGEKWEDAIKPEVLKEYYEASNKGQLKFVVDGSKRIWDEVDKAVDFYRNVGIDWDVWIMPVGANKEDQEKIQAQISEESLRRGYYVSPRVHCWVFGNVIGK